MNDIPHTSDFGDINTVKRILRIMYEHDCDGLFSRLIDRFGSVGRIFDATAKELAEVKGMTERTASFFEILAPVRRRALLAPLFRRRFDNERAIVDYICAYALDDGADFDAMIILDSDFMPVATERLVEPDRFREAVAKASRFDARKLIIFRYIPFETAESVVPSLIRLRELSNLLDILEALGIEIVDCINYTPFKFYGLNRAAHGGGMISARAASADIYPPVADMSAAAAELYENRIALKNRTETISNII